MLIRNNLKYIIYFVLIAISFLYDLVFALYEYIPDDDGDGIINDLDLCPNTPTGTVDLNGCYINGETCTVNEQCATTLCQSNICSNPILPNPKQLKITITNPSSVGGLNANVRITSISSTNSYINPLIQNVVNNVQLINVGSSYTWNTNPIDLSTLPDNIYLISGNICAVETPDLPFITELCNPFSGSFSVTGGA